MAINVHCIARPAVYNRTHHSSSGAYLPVLTNWHEIGSTSSGLLRSARAGDSAAWHRLISLYGPLVYRWCRRWPLSREDVADVFQDVFRTVAEQLNTFRYEQLEHNFRGWLWTITRSRAADHLRRQWREPGGVGGSAAQQDLERAAVAEEFESSDAPPPLEGIAWKDVEPILRAEFEQRTLAIFLRCVMDGRATAEVAGEFHTSPGAVRQARYRVLNRLRQLLAELS